MDTSETISSEEPSKVSSFFVQLGRGITRLPVIVMALGLLAIAIGYNGASGYTALAAQFPYLISGGVLGLGLIIIGVGMMVAQSHREDSARLEALLTQLVETTDSDSVPNDISELTKPSFAPKARAK